MINTAAISNLIREKKIPQIYSQLQTSSKEGMNTLDQCLNELLEKGIISYDEALWKSSNPKAIEESQSKPT